MKNTALKRKFFKKSNVVRPLYKKVSDIAEKKRDQVIHKKFNLSGHGVNFNRKILDGNVKILTQFSTNQLPGACDAKIKLNRKTVVSKTYMGQCLSRGSKISTKNNIFRTDTLGNVNISSKVNEHMAHRSSDFNVQDRWLRVYPAPKIRGESVCSVIFRCVVCQLGITGLLVLWTVLWVFVIHIFEGPYEKQTSLEFEQEQNQLIIDLATELRQITPISAKWRSAIEARIDGERELTILALGKGARLHPGCYWNLPGTFLFTVYVMTALGFGAPVPHTVWGRTSALVYAVVSVPTHIYLMVNMSTCIVVKVEHYVSGATKSYFDKIFYNTGKSTKESARGLNNSRISECNKGNKFRKKTFYFVSCLWVGRGVPLATLLYYSAGAVIFGLLRHKEPLDVLMFPLEFTTTGGLELVESHIRVLYGFYVEGAMVLVACALAALRRHSEVSANWVAEKYRLYQLEDNRER